MVGREAGDAGDVVWMMERSGVSQVSVPGRSLELRKLGPARTVRHQTTTSTRALTAFSKSGVN